MLTEVTAQKLFPFLAKGGVVPSLLKGNFPNTFLRA